MDDSPIIFDNITNDPYYNTSGQAVQQTDDGNIMLFGFSELGYKRDFYLVKIDQNGGQISSDTLDFGYDETLLNARRTTDGGFILCGYVSNIEDPSFIDKVILVKTDSQGQVSIEDFNFKPLSP